MNYVRLLTIAGSDSGGGAGIQADLKTFSALGCYGMSVITAVTAQNTLGVTEVHELPAEIVTAQLDAVLSDIGADAVKIGMLASAPIIAAVANRLRQYEVKRIVLDPVMVSTSGNRLLRDDAVQVMRETLIPLATLITPNLPEAEELLNTKIASEDTLQAAAERLARSGPQAVLIKGGHFNGVHSNDGLAVRDGDQVSFEWLEGTRVDTNNTHGTGCTLSSAIAAHLGKGLSIRDAVRAGKQYIQSAIESGAAYTLGRGHGPVHHFFEQWK